MILLKITNGGMVDTFTNKIVFTVAIFRRLNSVEALLLHIIKISPKNILLSGDVELNPGPITNDNSSLALISNTRADFLLNYRLYRHGLRPLDVGGGGDCFFKSVSHQLFGDSSHHLAIRYTAVQYLRENPERFIESVVDRLWSQY